MHLTIVLTVLASLSVCSCVQLGSPQAEEDPFYGMDAYKKAGGRVSGGVSGGTQSSSQVKPTAIVDESDIVWAPEDVNVPMPGGLEDKWKSPESKSWQVSHIEASRFSRSLGKPLLIWFTDTAKSPLCRRLSDELFSTTEFDDWANKHIVRLRVDSQIPHDERKTNKGVQKSNYIKKLKKQYNVLGHPTVLILAPGGEVVATYRGFKKGGGAHYWMKMKYDVSQSEDEYGKWREKMEKKGYRVWTNRKGHKTFARLVRYQPGKITLIDPDNNRGATSFRSLSDADQAWLMTQKKKADEASKR